MNVTLLPSQLSGHTDIIPSKSQAHRLLICAALSKAPVKIICPETSEDIEATARCLVSLGAIVERCTDGYYVCPIEKSLKKAYMTCGESGSTLRFILPVIGALGSRAELHLAGRLPERPLSPLWEELSAHGMKLSRPFENVISTHGKLQGGEFVLPGNISSQFVSGLLFALPFLDEDSTVRITGRLESKNYVDMTRDVLQTFGVAIRYKDNVFRIDSLQSAYYSGIDPLKAEGDWSNAAFWLVAGALSENGVTCGNLNFSSLQGDKKIVGILNDFGADVSIRQHSVSVKKGDMRGAYIDAADIPDLVPAIAVLACGAKGPTRIFNAGRLKIKESDRLKSIYGMLSSLGAEINLLDDGLIINGTGHLCGGVEIDSCNDHRIAMAAAVASSICDREITVSEAEAVNKSYPGFWEQLKKLGGKIKRQVQ